jgi:signal transduction histidine kinase
MAWADSEQILEVFTNIIKNALQALEGISNGDIIVMLKDGEEEVCITISDNGHGINEDIRDRIFTPNFTTKSTGTGLGLAISKNIVEGSEGRISFETSQKGTKFFVYLKKTP